MSTKQNSFFFFFNQLTLILTVFSLFGLSTAQGQALSPTGAYFGVTAKSTNLMRQYNPMIGGMAGFVFNNRIGLGGFGHVMTGQIEFAGSDLEQPGATDLYLKQGYGGVFAELFIIRNENIQLSTPIKLGYGKVGVFSQSTESVVEKSRLIVLEPEVHFDVKITKFLAIGTQVGYRLGDVDGLFNISDRNMSGFNVGLGVKVIR